MAPRYPFTSALVTGASSGIGDELTRQLAAAEVPTVVVARREERLRALADELPDIEVLVADLASNEGIDAVTARIADADRPIDLVVNNAGFGTSGTFHELDPVRMDEEISVNVAALTWLSHAALSAMVPRRRGWLLNVSSVASFQPAPGAAVYAATKAYVTSLSESLHEEVKGAGVTVTALCPGLIRTEFHDVAGADAWSAIPGIAWLDVADVVRDALRAVSRGRAVVVPGALYKTGAVAAGLTPRSIRRLASGLIPRG